MIKHFLSVRLCAVYIGLFLMGFIIGYGISTFQFRNTNQNTVNSLDFRQGDNTTILNDVGN